MFFHSGIHMACRHIQMYVLFASHKQVNLYTTLDNKTEGVSHLRRKYEAIFIVVKYTLLSILNLSLIKFARLFENWLEVFPKYGKPVVNKNFKFQENW